MWQRSKAEERKQGRGGGTTTGDNRGLVPRVLEYLFDRFSDPAAGGAGSPAGPSEIHVCRCSFYEIYNEQVLSAVGGVRSFYEINDEQGFRRAAVGTGAVVFSRPHFVFGRSKQEQYIVPPHLFLLKLVPRACGFVCVPVVLDSAGSAEKCRSKLEQVFFFFLHPAAFSFPPDHACVHSISSAVVMCPLFIPHPRNHFGSRASVVRKRFRTKYFSREVRTRTPPPPIPNNVIVTLKPFRSLYPAHHLHLSVSIQHLTRSAPMVTDYRTPKTNNIGSMSISILAGV